MGSRRTKCSPGEGWPLKARWWRPARRRRWCRLRSTVRSRGKSASCSVCWARRRWRRRSSRKPSRSRPAQKNICCGHCRGRRTVRNEDRLRGAKRRAFEHRGQGQGAARQIYWSATTARCRLGRRYQGRDWQHANLWLSSCLGSAATRGRRLGRPRPNHKRIYRVMKAHGLLLQRHAGGAEERRHDGRIAVDRSNLRWCSDGFELGCDNGDKVRIAFALDCCDREAMGFVATTEGIKGEDVRDLMLTAVEHRFGRVNRLPHTIEWLTDNGSGYIAHETRRFARDIGFEPRTTPVESPQSNGMAEAFVRTMKRDYARVSALTNAAAVIRLLPEWFAHYNTVHPHRALRYRSPREYIASRSNQENVSDL